MELTCTGAVEYGSIVYYSHFVPIAIVLILSVFVLFKTEFSRLSKVFVLFNILITTWLIGDVVTWVSTNFDIISFAWSPLDYINIIAFLVAVYFFHLLVRGREISRRFKIFLFSLSVPPAIMTIAGKTILSFDVANCEAINNPLITKYKLAIELLVILYIIYISVYDFVKNKDKQTKGQIAVLSLSMVAFLTTFSLSEYISSVTGIYEINLYSLFVLPLFLIVIIFAITNFKTFNIKTSGMRLVVYILLILVGSQFFFLENSTTRLLTAITFIISLALGFLLLRLDKKEILQREKIESLASDLKSANTRLLSLDKQKSEFVSIATHQLRAPLTAMKGYTSLILEGDFGEINKETKQAVSRIYDSANTLTNIVNDYLNISRIELGTMKYNFTTLDLKELVDNVIGELRPNLEKKGLKLSFTTTPDGVNTRFMIHADKDKLKQVVANLVDNSIKYTPSGSIDISIVKNTLERKVTLSIRDTGVGISKDVMPKLFAKFVRAENANKQNIYGTGLGLYIAKQIVDAHKGHIKAISDGDGKGSTFYVVFDMEV